MKPILFAKGETDFTTNGLGRLDCISCKVIEERNGMFELEAEIPVSSPHAMEVEYLSIIGAKAHDGGNIQAFTVYKITKPMNGRFMVYARHLSYRLSDIPCSPFTVAASPQAAANTLAGLKNNALEPCPFNFSTDVTTGNPYTQNVPASIRQRLGGVEGSVLDQFGGEFEFDNWNVKLWKSRGRLSNVTGISLRYGKNITDINQEEEIASTVTGVVPFWIDTDGNNLVTLPEHVVYADNAANYPYHITQVLDLSSEFEEKPTVVQLRGVANAYVHKDGFGVPKVSIKVSFANLWESEEYKDIAPLERVQLCDEVSVYFEKLGISSIAKVVKTDFDVLKERYNNVEVGSLRTTLAQAVTDRDKDIDTTFIQEMTRVSTAITNATAWLTNANGYVVAVKNTDGSWKELLFMNTNDPQTATQGIRFNNNGIGFWNKATDGGNVLDGPYGTAWTIDGRLGDFADKNFWNIRTGDFSLSASATVGGQTVQQIADAAQAAAEATAAENLATEVRSINSDIEDLQDQIDGNITTWYYDYVPTLNNVPASTWTTDEDKNNHIGDLFYQDSTGYAWRFMLDNTVTPAVYKWIRISDEDIAAALAAAQTAQDTADNKRRVFITQPVPPYDVGDLWAQGSNGDLKRCATAKTATQAYAAADWVLASKYTDDSAVDALDNALDQEEVFKRLTNNDQNQGIFLDAQTGKLYINATYIKGGIIEVGGSNYQQNASFRVKDTSDNVVGTWSKDGFTANKGNFGKLNIDSSDSSIYSLGNVLIYSKDTLYSRTDTIAPWTLPSKVDKNIFISFRIITTFIGTVLEGETYPDGSDAGDLIIRRKLKNSSSDYTVIETIDFKFNQEVTSNTVITISDLDDYYYQISVKLKQVNSKLSSALRTIKTSEERIINITDTGIKAPLSGTFNGNVNIWEWLEDEHKLSTEGYVKWTGFDDLFPWFTNYYSDSGFCLGSGIETIDKSSQLAWLPDKGLAVLRTDFDETTDSGYIASDLLNDKDPTKYKGDNSSESSPYNYYSIQKPKAFSVYYSRYSQRFSRLEYNRLRIIHNLSGDNDYTYTSLTYNNLVKYTSGGQSGVITWDTGSDERLKKNIKALDVDLSKNLIDATEPKEFEYKNSEGKHYGMIAQEARELLDSLGETDAVLEHKWGVEDDYENNNDYRTLDYIEYIPHLINYVKDLRAVVDRQQAEIDQLKEIVKKLSM